MLRAEPLVVAGHVYPERLAGATWLRVTNYAHDGSPGGAAVSYLSEDFKADIYIYDAGDPSWVEKPLDERFDMEVASIPQVMAEMERREIYSTVVVTPAEVKKKGALAFTHYGMTFGERGKEMKSHYYLAKFKKRLLKFRITAFTSTPDSILLKAFDEAGAFYSRRE